jgi:pimeloyl-ACP methyl ester carboxylesterase
MYANASPITWIDPDGRLAIGFPGGVDRSGSGANIPVLDAAISDIPLIGPTYIADSNNFDDLAAAYNWAMDQLAANPNQPIIIYGHSLGAEAAVEFASQLVQAGQSVDLVIALDPIEDITLPAGVTEGACFYTTDGGLGGGQLISPTDNVENYALPASIDHSSMITDPSVLNFFARLVRGAVNDTWLQREYGVQGRGPRGRGYGPLNPFLNINNYGVVAVYPGRETFAR